MSTEIEERKPGSPKGTKKPRKVFGRQKAIINGVEYRFEFRSDGLHSKPKHSKKNTNGVNAKELVVPLTELIHPQHTLVVDNREYLLRLESNQVVIRRNGIVKAISFLHLIDEFEEQYRLPLAPHYDPEIEALSKLAK